MRRDHLAAGFSDGSLSLLSRVSRVLSVGVLGVLGFLGIGSLGCGGSVQDNVPSSATGGQTTLAGPGVSPDGSPYGSWELISLKGEKKKPDTEVHNHFYMELRSDGKAIVRLCTKPYYEPGSVIIRCADSQAYDCTYGTVKEDEDGTWRVELPDLEAVRADDRGELDVTPNGGLLLRHFLPSYASGTFVRVVTSSPTQSCSGSAP